MGGGLAIAPRGPHATAPRGPHATAPRGPLGTAPCRPHATALGGSHSTASSIISTVLAPRISPEILEECGLGIDEVVEHASNSADI
jgi:hypothetical protein